eukprot:226431_1
MATTLAYYLAIVALIINILLIPLTFYFGYQLYLHWNAQYMLARRRHIILGLYILLLYYQLLYFPFDSIDFVFSLHLSNTFRQSLYITSVITFAIGASLVTLRIYLLYFDHEYNHVLLTKRWQILVDPAIEKSNWFLINRHTKYGNDIYILKYILCPSLLIYIAVFLSIRFALFIVYKSEFVITIVDFAFYGVTATAAIIVSIVFWRRYPNFNDNLFIRKEITITVAIFMAFPITAIALVVCISVFDDVVEIIMSIVLIITSLAMAAIGWMMLKYPQKANTDTPQKQAHVQKKQSEQNVSWAQIISSKEGFESFANFLELEFSIENILFVTEYVQLKHVMLQNQSLKRTLAELPSKYELELADSIPLSLIAKEFDDGFDSDNTSLDLNGSVYKAMNKLFCKYITASAALEVNISSGVRVRLRNVFQSGRTELLQLNNNQIETILQLMEMAVAEVSNLMGDSFLRFKRQNVYRELLGIA